MKVVAVVSLFISIFCLICVGGLSCWVFVFDERSPFFPPSSGLVGRERKEMCVPCLQVSPDPLDSVSGSSMWDEVTVRYDEENDTKICCAVTAVQYTALFKLILQRQQEVRKLADYLADSNNAKEREGLPVAQQFNDPKAPVSAHLVFKHTNQRTADSENKYVQHWKSPAESPMSHLLHGLQLLKNGTRLLVQTSGLYYVYTQILYNPTSSPTTTTTTTTKPHFDVTSAYVRRYSILHPALPTFLLKSRHTRSDAAVDRDSSYVGGVVRLYKGDRLFVQVSKPELISYDEVASFFGLFKVGP
ncbi:hypothetical protein ACOMHN_025650 [Nucella lapillus]